MKTCINIKFQMVLNYCQMKNSEKKKMNKNWNDSEIFYNNRIIIKIKSQKLWVFFRNKINSDGLLYLSGIFGYNKLVALNWTQF